MSKKLESWLRKDGQRRRSPRISAQDCRRRQATPTAFSSDSRVRQRVEQNPEDHHQQPPSWTSKRTRRQLGMKGPNNNEHLDNCDNPLVVKPKSSAELDDHDLSAGHPSVMSPIPFMPEKRVLELILDILQRRDTYEIFAEPVDPNEVEDYYEIIKEPMDFGTMRAKLHEGMYENFEQFEHDVFLISKNAMHFNSTGTIYFRQARAIYDLAKKVLHFLKTDSENFELEFSGTRRRSGRTLHGEGKSLNFDSCPKLTTNVKSDTMTTNVLSKRTSCSLSGPSNLRRTSRAKPRSSCTDACVDTGARNGRRSKFIELDRRCTYEPWMPSVNENECNDSTNYNDPKSLAHVIQWNICYRKSLISFAKDLGPTAQIIAKRKLQGLWKDDSEFLGLASNCSSQAAAHQNPALFASSEKGSGADSVFRTTIDLTDTEKSGDVETSQKQNMDDYVATGAKAAIDNKALTVCKNICEHDTDEVHPNLHSSTSGLESLISSAVRMKETGKKPAAATTDCVKTDDQASHLTSLSGHGSSDKFELKLSNVKSSTPCPWLIGRVSSMTQANPERGMSSFSSAAPEPNCPITGPLTSPVRFNYRRFVRSRLNDTNHCQQDGYKKSRLQRQQQQVPVNEELFSVQS